MNHSSSNIRLLVPLRDGLSVEAVYYGSATLCLSTQAGCGIGCPFCASGAKGLRRNLTSAEIAGQVAAACARGLIPRRLTLSGIGEPLHNRAAVADFMDDSKLPVSLTTTGGSPAVLAAALHWPHNGLMLSRHAGSEDLHRRFVPPAPPLEDLAATVSRGLAGLSRRRRRHLGVNYLLLAGSNDHRAELDRLLSLAAAWPEATIHLLACNPVPGRAFVSPPTDQFDACYTYLKSRHPHVRRPNSWRRQSEGGCGTLVLHAQRQALRAYPLSRSY